MLRVIEIKRTSWVCPSQWKGKTIDGGIVSVSYRWGTLTVEVDSKVIFSKHIGKPTTEADDDLIYDGMRQQGWNEEVIAKLKESTNLQRHQKKANGDTPLSFDSLISYKELRKQTVGVCELPDNDL